jgi:hypothetical protein
MDVVLRRAGTRDASPVSESVKTSVGESTMKSTTLSLPDRPAYELRFQSLFDDGRALAFPCDEAGHVDMDALSERARHNYLYARAVIGREFSMPAVRRSTLSVH